jgi:hypothetical protein
MELPPFPDSGEPCVTTTPYVLSAVCVGGFRQLAWVFASEVINTPPGLVAVGGSCAKTEAIKTAREKGWSADELVKVLKALG